VNQNEPRTGFFGKLASHGDFVSRRLSPTFVREWDDWLQAGLQYSRECLGEHWRTRYLCSPIWHFALAAGVCGESDWAGVLMPSVDRVGRYFPLTLAYGGPHAPVIERLRRDADWYAELERLALSSLEHGFSLELFDRALSRLPAPSRYIASEPVGGQSPGSLWFEAQEQAHVKDVAVQWAAQLASLTEGRSLARHSLFWSEGSSNLPATLLLCQGLPTEQVFVQMLAGRCESVA
jgi:type VI secretion system protein ImpM